MKILLGAIVVCLGVSYMVFSNTRSSPETLTESKQIETQEVVIDHVTKSKEIKNTDFDRQEIRCLALNIYHEARNSSFADKIATADVVINRKHDNRYPSTICAVVSQGVKPGRKDCQFSWKCDGKSERPRDLSSWDEAKIIAYNMYVHETYRGITEGATHYHATYVKPYWAKSKQMVGRIGAHIYYRWE